MFHFVVSFYSFISLEKEKGDWESIHRLQAQKKKRTGDLYLYYKGVIFHEIPLTTLVDLHGRSSDTNDFTMIIH